MFDILFKIVVFMFLGIALVCGAFFVIMFPVLTLAHFYSCITGKKNIFTDSVSVNGKFTIKDKHNKL